MYMEGFRSSRHGCRSTLYTSQTVPIFTLVTIALLSACVVGNPHSTFHHFETLQPHHVSVREKRSADVKGPHAITATFKAFQKTFTMTLTPGSRVLHPEAKVQLVDHSGKSTPYEVDHSKFYTGWLDGDVTQEVDASHTDGVWIAHIHTPDEFYALEPLHFFDSRASARDMIVYRGRDIKEGNATNQQPFCGQEAFDELLKHEMNTLGKLHGTLHAGSEHHTHGPKHNPKIQRYGNLRRASHPLRSKVAVAPKREDRYGKMSKHDGRYGTRSKREGHYGKRATECSIMAVASYDLYKGIGQGNPSKIVQTLMHVYAAADHVFRNTNFGGVYTDGYGIVVTGVHIHTSYSNIPRHYNSANLSMSPEEVLRALTMHSGFLDYCLAHVSMQRNWGATLGLAAVANYPHSWTNGICAAVNKHDSRNVGISTIADSAGVQLPLQVYSMVVAHEIGHNWGANHDPRDASATNAHECSPCTREGGKYLMWPYSGLFKDPHSHKFSPCSRRSVKAVLEARASKCFLAKDHYSEICGNGIKDKPEDCDPGLPNLQTDPCCEPNCRFKPNALCSPRNAPCCTKTCQLAPSTQPCFPKGGLTPCYLASRCLGNDAFTCPPPTPKPNGVSCGDGGQCVYGRCASFCENKGLASKPLRHLKPCECDSNTRVMCQQCCVDVGIVDGKCEVMGGSLRDGVRCLKGVCQKGVCTRGHVAAPGNNFFLATSSSKMKNGMSRGSPGIIVSPVWGSLCFLLSALLLAAA